MKSFTSISFLKYTIAFVAMGVVIACASNKIKTQETNYKYDNKIKDLNPKYIVYHTNDSISYLYLEIETKELLYVRENSSKPFESCVTIQYNFYDGYRGKVLLDSATKVLYDYKIEAGNKKILARIPLSIDLGEEGVLKIVASDIYKKIRSESVIEINKRDKLSKQFFMLTEESTGEVCFDNYVTLNNSLVVQSDFNGENTFFVDYFNTKYPPSKPPFSKNKLVEIPEKKDSSFILSMENKSGNVVLDKLGSYFIRSIDSSSYSLILQRLDTNFKALYNYKGMVEPLKYICTSAEFTSLTNATDKRKAVEDFWLKVAGSKERGKIVIEEYYRRVELANRFFTSYKEGWKTDRGMLSIVMGLPNTIYKTRKGETWIYGTPHNMMMSLTFNFNKENVEKSDNDYQLIRYRTYRDYWYRACESWRRGRIYNFN